MLTDAALGPLRRMAPGKAGLKLVAALAARPGTVARRSLAATAELAKIARGRSEVEPSKRDKRFADPAWAGNPLLRRLVQAYLVTGKTIDDLLEDAALEWREYTQLRFVADNVIDAVAPSNLPFANPTALKAVIDTGGRNFVEGARQFVGDMRKPPRIPSMVDTDAFEVGQDLAISPGAVVLRTEIFELIQYEPQTSQVREIPVLMVPPMINKYYIADLAPGRSMLEHFVGAGLQTFTMSWRNPDERHRDWNFDSYVQSVLDALAAVEKITGSTSTQVFGLCAGGITCTAAIAYLAAHGEQDRIAGLTLGVTMLDQARSGTVGAMVGDSTAQLAIADSSRRGYLDGRALAGVFAWLRPNDLIWNYWVNNYLLGKKPPAFDVLYWNGDTTRMSAGLHKDFIKMAVGNTLVHANETTVLGTPIDLSKVTVDSYAIAGIADHIVPWQNAYRTAHLLGSNPRFVLSTSGHIAALVNPPSNEKASFQLNDALPEDPDAWLAGAGTRKGSWWTDWTEWVGSRVGGERSAPEQLGCEGFSPGDPAPGTYVRQG
ncbi:MAG: alpha/beta fold hydrolase [Actinomycetota bacterium]|nr:alpha/beta fold hydrolase [Actinomycetota bacterium]